MAKLRNRYNQAPHLTQDTDGKVTTSQLDITNESQEVSPFPAGDYKASINRRTRKLFIAMLSESTRPEPTGKGGKSWTELSTNKARSCRLSSLCCSYLGLRNTRTLAKKKSNTIKNNPAVHFPYVNNCHGHFVRINPRRPSVRNNLGSPYHKSENILSVIDC